MSKLHLINEIETTVKMVAAAEYDPIKLALYLDDLLSNYKIEAKDSEMIKNDNTDYVHMFISSLQIENYSAHTLKNYRYELDRFKNYLNKNLLQATTADIRAYLSAHSHLKSSTIVTKMDILSSFYGWLVKEEELLKNPCLKIKRPKTEKKVREGLTIIELEKVRAACKNARQRALIEVFYSTGCRLDELRKLDVDDIDWQSSSAIVFGKGSKERRVYLSEKAKYYLKKYLKERTDDCPALIASERRPIRRLTNEGIQYQVKKIREASSIDKPLHPHIMRHTFAQLSLDNGMELADLQALMGHENADTTARYAQVSDARKQNAFKRFHAQ
ncbi:tyrosine-type recombinase/integrase [Solibacillus sp. FSL R7-0668]|uniref:tyrosine-type recombinase/integrase n=1 Tax=Solibacillus sp. FSL R7-0668 TaxID=2921688 RepID=UPI0030FA1119